MKIYQIDAFTKEPFNGNSAGVTFGNGITDDIKRKIAKEMNLAETAFLSKSDKADFRLQWFTPSIEVELCGHATIASLHFLKEHSLIKNGETITFDTKSGILKCKMENDRYFMQIPLYKMQKYSGERDSILSALGISENILAKEIPWVLLENTNMYVCIKSLNELKNVSPNFKELKKISERNNKIGGFALFTTETIEKDNFTHCRYFVPYWGIDEDPVTGSVNGPLLPVLKYLGLITDEQMYNGLTFEQGDFMERSGRVTAKFFPQENELYISGDAVTVIKGEIIF
ncbi:MAG: PhzF family phenazine biosynthesis protein [Ignavibacteriales bacterium CG_4_9_14_3_um_filter_30_11]|nr:MAG: PhzF family phenazine biosynthesis protein [Ignavibacteriales bacterium CG_4_9_14_3_um_filter_30_11]